MVNCRRGRKNNLLLAVLPSAGTGKRGALSMEMKGNTHPHLTVTPKDHRNSPTGENNLF